MAVQDISQSAFVVDGLAAMSTLPQHGTAGRGVRLPGNG
jgi:hypothetical protein